jgi:outer membrane protein
MNRLLTILLIVCSLILLPVAGVYAGDSGDSETPLIQSTQPYTADNLFEIAQRHNPDHLKIMQSSSLKGSVRRSAWGTLMPSLDVGFSISQSSYYNPTYSNPDGTVSTYPRTDSIYQTVVDTTNWTLKLVPTGTYTIPIAQGKNRSSSEYISLRETIFLGGQQYFTIKNSDIQNRITNMQVASSEIELYAMVRQGYYNVLAQKKLLDLAKQLLDQKQELLKLAKARFDVGSVTELDVLQAEIDVGNQQNAVITAENNLKMAKENLNTILGVSLDSDYPLVEEFDIYKPAYSLNDLIQSAKSNRQDYQITLQQQDLQENLVHISRSSFLPALSASITHSRSQNSGANVDFTLTPKNRNTTASLSLNWNLFSGFSDHSSYQQNRVSYNNSLHDSKKQEMSIESDVRKAYYALMQTYEKSVITEKNRELASRQLALEQERYRLGATSQLNLRTAQITFEQAETDRIANIFAFRSNLAELERSVGKKL